MNTFVSAIRGMMPHRADLGRWSITFVVFLITAKLGQFLYIGVGTAPAFIWPPAGVALAALFLWSNRMTSAVLLASFVAVASTGAPIVLIIVTVLGNTLQALAGAYMFRFFNFRPNISRLRDTLLLFGAALIITTIMPSLTFVATSIWYPLTAGAGELWRDVWVGGILSVLVVTPLITCFMQDARIMRDRLIEHTFALLFVCVASYVAFWTNIDAIFEIPVIYIMLVPFFWVALRFSPRSTALALFLASCIAIGGAVVHTPAGHPLGQWLFQTELLLEVFAAIFLTVSSAIEDRRTATAELRAHVHQLEHAVTQISEQDSAKNDFLAILAHELRNPLAPVLSTLELLRLRRPPTDDEAPLVAGAEQRLHMMSRLLDDLLDLSRVSEKRMKLQKEYVSLRTIAERSVESARPQMDKSGHQLEVTLPEHDAVLFADPLRIEQVLVNVLNNAAKYTQRGGRIEFKAETHGSRAIISIRDNGVGIEASMLARIFEPFIQVANKYGTSGVGVGLALAKQLVELHDGTINALSAGLGRGSTFVIEFPVIQNPPNIAPTSQSFSKKTARALNVLVVDDNQAGTEALGRLLSFRGHHTMLSFTGADGISRALEEKPDAILLDIGLPDMEGYDVARRLRAAGSDALIIALTGFGQDDDRKKALDAGCNGHLTKPVGLKDIEAVLASRFAI